jgi:uncharacterized protein
MAGQARRTRVPPTSTQPHWDGLALGTLLLPRCERCGTWNPVSSLFCSHCHATDLCWRITSGRGKLISYSTVHQAPYRAFAEKVPYTVAVIELAEGPAMIARLAHVDGFATTDIGRDVALIPNPSEPGLATFGFATAPTDDRD